MRLIDADALIEEYDRVHVGPPGGARKLMEDAPTIEERPTSDHDAREAWNRRAVRCECGGATFVADSRVGTAGIIRRRVCKICRMEIFTLESVIDEFEGREMLSQIRKKRRCPNDAEDV